MSAPGEWHAAYIYFDGHTSAEASDRDLIKGWLDDPGLWSVLIDAPRLVALEWAGPVQLGYMQYQIFIHEDLVK